MEMSQPATTRNNVANAKKVGQYVLLLFLTFLVLGPFLLGLWTSLMPTADISKGALWSSHISLDNYVAAITTTPILR